MDLSFEELVERAAEERGEEVVPRDFISEALIKIRSGEVQVETYPTGQPTLMGTYDLALRLYLMEKIYAQTKGSEYAKNLKDMCGGSPTFDALDRELFTDTFESLTLDQLRRIAAGPFCSICGCWGHTSSFHT